VTHKFEDAGSFTVSLTFHGISKNAPKTITAGIVVKDTKCGKVMKYWTAVVGFLAILFAVIEYLDVDISAIFSVPTNPDPSSMAPGSDLSGLS
jgi:PKD repeat protein